jgi:hypothetical protein
VGYGTGGTLRGVARVLKARRPETRIVLCESDRGRLHARAGAPQADCRNRADAYRTLCARVATLPGEIARARRRSDLQQAIAKATDGSAPAAAVKSADPGAASLATYLGHNRAERAGRQAGGLARADPSVCVGAGRGAVSCAAGGSERRTPWRTPRAPPDAACGGPERVRSGSTPASSIRIAISGHEKAWKARWRRIYAAWKASEEVHRKADTEADTQRQARAPTSRERGRTACRESARPIQEVGAWEKSDTSVERSRPGWGGDCSDE